MSNFKLNLPTDIPWERICVTEDMIDRKLCDNRLPAKWQSSLAVFKYCPDNDFQLYPKYTITYLRVTATITGYQPLDKEIQGTIDWNGVNVSTVPGLTDLLNSYNPCHGAILQVVVGPHNNSANIPVDQYPFFLDFEPKKRELYEMATDTNEKQSRSVESLNLTKAGGSTQSMEILDIDMGGGGGGGQASFAGTGAGFNYSAPHGQWGTKRINTDESMTSRSSDVGQEKRETFSFSTQISQMYHLLDSYHIGTNRAVFFIQPRPHTLEEPSGFVKGPRPVEGIQEFFLVVAQLKGQDDFCVSLRLDTSHLTTTPIMDYERKSDTTSIASAVAPVASDKDIPAERLTGQACFGACWDVGYQCYRTDANDNVTYNAPDGFIIEGFNDLINDAEHGTTDVAITPNGASLNINVSAHGHRCTHDSGTCVNCDDVQIWAGHARRQVQVNLRSTTPTQQVGEDQALMITTRGLCCCVNEKFRMPANDFVVGVKQIPSYLALSNPITGSASASTFYNTINMPPRASAALAGATALSVTHPGSMCPECAGKSNLANGSVQPTSSAAAFNDTKYRIRLANELSNFIKTETLRSLNDPYVRLQKYHETDFFAKQLEFKLVQVRDGRQMLEKTIEEEFPSEVVRRLEEYFKKDARQITRRNLLQLKAGDLAKITGMNEADIQKIKLSFLGVKFNPQQPG